VTLIEIIAGPVGDIELALDSAHSELADSASQGIAIIGHPHPLFGGTRDNKVVQTLSRALCDLGYLCIRPNFRGVGKTQGVHDHGVGETLDMRAVYDWAGAKFPLRFNHPIVLAGFSFGSFVVARLNQQLPIGAVERMIMVGTAAGKWPMPNVPSNSLVIHGDQDDVIELSAVMLWAKAQTLPVHVIADTGHFFHGKLNQLKNLIYTTWQRQDLVIPELGTRS
jgi:uncharacterized protein